MPVLLFYYYTFILFTLFQALAESRTKKSSASSAKYKIFTEAKK